MILHTLKELIGNGGRNCENDRNTKIMNNLVLIIYII